MKITYDKSVDAAYIYTKDSKMAPGEAALTYPCDVSVINSQINLDFDKNNVLIGIEILDASTRLPKELLESAEIIG